MEAVILSPMSHAGYYPGGKVMTMKVVFEKGTYRLLGAQIVGYEGVDKRIDVLATAIHAGMKATQLKDLRIPCRDSAFTVLFIYFSQSTLDISCKVCYANYAKLT